MESIQFTDLKRNQADYDEMVGNFSEQLDVITAARTTYMEVLAQTISAINAGTEEMREKDEQQHDPEEERDKKMAELHSACTAILFTRSCGVRNVRNEPMLNSTVSPTSKMSDCDLTDWSPRDGVCVGLTGQPIECDVTCPQSDPYKCGGLEWMRRDLVVAPLEEQSADRFEEKPCNTHDCLGAEVCTARQDLVLMGDQSGSLRKEGAEILRDFIATLTGRSPSMYSGVEDMRLGVVAFGNGSLSTQPDGTSIAEAGWAQGLTGDLALAEAKIKELTWMRGFTNMAQGSYTADSYWRRRAAMIPRAPRWSSQLGSSRWRLRPRSRPGSLRIRAFRSTSSSSPSSEVLGLRSSEASPASLAKPIASAFQAWRLWSITPTCSPGPTSIRTRSLG